MVRLGVSLIKHTHFKTIQEIHKVYMCSGNRDASSALLQQRGRHSLRDVVWYDVFFSEAKTSIVRGLEYSYS